MRFYLRISLIFTRIVLVVALAVVIVFYCYCVDMRRDPIDRCIYVFSTLSFAERCVHLFTHMSQSEVWI